MATFKLTIELGNDAMQTTEDLVEALQKVASYYTGHHDDSYGMIRDRNGNTVGGWSIGND